MKNVINLICLLLFLGLGSFFYLVFAEEKGEAFEEKFNQSFFCGTSYLNSSPALANEGKRLFRNYCASCHDKSMRKHMTGPPLSEFTEIWNSDTLLILDYLRSSEKFLDTSRLARAEYLKVEYKGVSSHGFVNLTKVEIKELLAYINS